MKLIDEGKRFYKGNTHAHTTLSDGRRTPEQVKKMFSENGYDFLVISDHWHTVPTEKYGDMLVLSGMEFDYMLSTQALHVVGVFPNAEAVQGFSRGRMDYQMLIDAINARGGAAIAAHPAWSLNTPEFLKSLNGICAVEVYNSFSGEPWNAARADSSQILDVAAANGWVVPQVAADDCHFYEGEELKSYIMLQADELTPEGVIAALKAGSFYASQGPEILDAQIEGDELILHTSPVRMCTFASNLVWVDGRCRVGENMTEHVCPLHRTEGETYIRCEITDDKGRKAWLSPVKL